MTKEQWLSHQLTGAGGGAPIPSTSGCIRRVPDAVLPPA